MNSVFSKRASIACFWSSVRPRRRRKRSCGPASLPSKFLLLAGLALAADLWRRRNGGDRGVAQTAPPGRRRDPLRVRADRQPGRSAFSSGLWDVWRMGRCQRGILKGWSHPRPLLLCPFMASRIARAISDGLAPAGNLSRSVSMCIARSWPASAAVTPSPIVRPSCAASRLEPAPVTLIDGGSAIVTSPRSS